MRSVVLNSCSQNQAAQTAMRAGLERGFAFTMISTSCNANQVPSIAMQSRRSGSRQSRVLTSSSNSVLSGKFVLGSRAGGRVDEVKTEYSKDHVPLDPRLAEVLLQRRSVSVFPRDMDWLFANPVTGRPFHQESLQKSQIKRAAKAANWERTLVGILPPHLSLLA